MARWRDSESDPLETELPLYADNEDGRIVFTIVFEILLQDSPQDSLTGLYSRFCLRISPRVYRTLTKTFSKNLAKTPENCLLNYLLNCFEEPTRSLGSSQQVRRLAWIVSSISQSEECEDPAHVRPAAERSCFQSKDQLLSNLAYRWISNRLRHLSNASI